MNNFILVYSKQELEIDISILDNEIDTLYKQNDNHLISSSETIKEIKLAKDNLLMGVEADNCLVDHTDLSKSIFVVGDPYKMEPESPESILDIIGVQNPKQIYEKVGGAYSWINIDLKEQNIEINTDFFGK